MYIRKQPSGNRSATAAKGKTGRGEYEISGDFESVPPVRARQLIGNRLYIRFGRYGYKFTECVVTDQGGKKRLHLTNQRLYIHAARQVLASLLMPEPRRDERDLIGGQPTIMAERYIVRRMNFATLDQEGDVARVTLGDLDLWNGSQEDAENFGRRMAEVERLHDNAAKFPQPIRGLLEEHRQLIEAPQPMPVRGEQIVHELMTEMEDLAPDYNIDYVSGTDVLQPLKEIVNLPPVEEPIAIDLIPEEDIEIRLREAAKWRRFAAVRGPESAVFRRLVREAYDSTCIVCGIRLPPSEHCRVPGVDSAHILPWATHDMDWVCNGLCLCKLHHWAFDQQLIAITVGDDGYSVSVTERARLALGPAALAQLEAVAGPIPPTRLPQNPDHRPRPQFLVQLFQLVGA